MGNGKNQSAITGAATGGALGGPWGAAAGAVGGYLLGQDDNSGDYYKNLMEQAQNIPLPVLKEYYPELYKQIATLNPEMETSLKMGPSAMDNVSVDPRLRQAQMNALLKMQDIGANQGMTAQDKLNASQAQAEMAANVQGQTGAIQQQMATRGLSGGMSEMVAKQLAAQQGANRQADMGMQSKAQGESRALQALMQSGQLGGQMGQQDFSQQAQQAQAKDMINKFNLQNQQGIMSQNTQTRNQAAAANASGAQNVHNQNVGASNSAQQYNLNIPQQQYANQMSKYGLQASAGQGAAQAQQQSAQQNNQFLGNAMQAGAYAFGNKQNTPQDDFKKKQMSGSGYGNYEGMA